MRTRVFLGLPLVAVAIFALAGPALGAGFELRSFDAKGASLSNAFTGLADTPAAVAYNPAGMSQLDGLQGSASIEYVQAYIHFEGADPAEGSDTNEPRADIVPSTFVTAEVSEYFHLGLGVFAPFGVDVGWDKDWPGRYIAYDTRVENIEVVPSASVKIPFGGNVFAVGGGLRISRTAVQLKRAIDLSAIGFEDGFLRLRGDNDRTLGLSWDLGVLLSLFDRKIRLGAIYRAAVERVAIRGTAEFTNVPAVVGFPPATHARTHLVYPDEFKAGIAVQPIDPLTVTFDFAWTNWSRLNKIFVHLPDLDQVSVLDERWDDSYFVALGAEFKAVPDLLALRGGLYWDETPTRAPTRSPAIPDSTRYGFSVGVGLTPIPALPIDLTYMAVFLRDQTKNNLIGAESVRGGSPRANGEFETYAHEVLLTVGLKF